MCIRDSSSEAVRLRYSWQVLWSYARTADDSACISPFSKINLNYSRNSIWSDNCAMNLKIDPCSHNITQLTRQKGIKSLWQSSEDVYKRQTLQNRLREKDVPAEVSSLEFARDLLSAVQTLSLIHIFTMDLGFADRRKSKIRRWKTVPLEYTRWNNWVGTSE